MSRIHGVMSGGLPTNCDGSNPAESDFDKINADLYAALWDTTNGTTDGDLVGVRPAGQCENFGVNTARFGRGEQWACYTHDPDGRHDSTLKEQLQCDNSENATIIWGNEVTMNNSNTQGEDHPSFEFYTGTDDLVVTGTERGATQGVAARVHFPDAAGTPIVRFGSSGGGAVDHSDIAKGNGKLQMVFRDGKGSSAEIRYVECASASAVDDCTLVGDWAEDASPVASGGTYPDADNPEIAVDGDNQFVLFQYNANGGVGNAKYRVALAERCGSGAWTISDVRATPDFPDDDQTTMIGHPSIVLNRDENIVHVVFAEMANYDGNQFPSIIPTSNHQLFWARRGYTQCPS